MQRPFDTSALPEQHESLKTTGPIFAAPASFSRQAVHLRVEMLGGHHSLTQQSPVPPQSLLSAAQVSLQR